jgi:aromatic ring-opening dioxygenase catalytic subunit (LigB family)
MADPEVQGRPTPYAQPFLDAAISALASSKPLEATLSLFKHPLFKSAHPTPEHLLGLPVAVAATDAADKVEEICVSNHDGLGWGMWRWYSA